MTLKEYLDHNGHSLRAFARKCDVSETTLRRIIGGEAPNLKIAARISDETLGAVGIRDMLPKEAAVDQ